MENNSYIFLDQMKGEWFLQENFYLLFDKQQKHYKERVSLLKNSPNSKFDICSFLIENMSSDKSLFKLEKINANVFTIVGVNRSKQIDYKEHVCLVNNNLMISFIIIKNLQKKKYLGVKASSYIKLIQ
uniref:hypothetical protein n=1 Tax=Symphyocladia marchantioides TaxID=88360 RepID=UPI0022FD83E5|nr:hypothetical protein PNW48_pgp117 [Symphyocladia marchantioides]WAX03854.1 hypothetical protein [Symphyocladia marchantioides]